ncbi:hypothetical protein [Streptomyces sp. NPDC058678]|uniref:hypothetical protein n=1 Tax=Streptomyces sp. NPDC058678 TaxID=3346595 RepID=UPI00365FC77F
MVIVQCLPAPHPSGIRAAWSRASERGGGLPRGEIVEHPASHDARALHGHLRALREHGIAARLRPVLLTEDGREQLTYIPGGLALPPFRRSRSLVARRVADGVAVYLRAPAERGGRGMPGPPPGLAGGHRKSFTVALLD